jgi:hypothetical protein
MKTLVITEGKLDQLLLDRVLRADPPHGQFRVVAAGGLSSAISLARSYLATGGDRIALVLDADTTNPNEIRAKQSEIEELLEAVGSKTRFTVRLIVPEAEALLFSDRRTAESLFKRRLSEQEWAEAQYQPHKVLSQVMQRGRSLEHLLNDHDLSALAHAGPIEDLRHFIAGEDSPIASAHETT